MFGRPGVVQGIYARAVEFYRSRPTARVVDPDLQARAPQRYRIGVDPPDRRMHPGDLWDLVHDFA
jgi:hypothetical protein